MPTAVFSQLAELEARIDALEAAQGETVSGWQAAARVVGLSVKTIKLRMKNDPQFPRPSRLNTFTKQDRYCTRPTWRRTELIKYKHHV